MPQSAACVVVVRDIQGLDDALDGGLDDALDGGLNDALDGGVERLQQQRLGALSRARGRASASSRWAGGPGELAWRTGGLSGHPCEYAIRSNLSAGARSASCFALCQPFNWLWGRQCEACPSDKSIDLFEAIVPSFNKIDMEAASPPPPPQANEEPTACAETGDNVKKAAVDEADEEVS